ncbi:helix-turn-helix transcriptional regulator [Aurantiacibacter gilvus]|uniref:Response regulator transcription factor n=1 Tax=Aurantiacibacter gilvus TaxID=3139141 RepID=A0ABU9IEA6_9SPHN
MWRAALAYGALIALLSLLLAWLDWRHVTRMWSTEAYVLAIAVIFAALGLWLGVRLTPRRRPATFVRNERALASLGISPRETEVLDLLAQGAANKVIARRLDISPNTVKTHVARLFEKLGASNRTEAIAKARELRLLP